MRDASRRTWLTGRAVVAAMSVAAAACGSTGASSTLPGNDLVDVAEALCIAASEPDLAEAIAGFQRAHGPLHDLAEQVSQTDRQVAARLLRAKQQVEADIDEGLDAAPLRDHLTELSGASVAGLLSLDLSPPASCPTPEPSP